MKLPCQQRKPHHQVKSTQPSLTSIPPPPPEEPATRLRLLAYSLCLALFFALINTFPPLPPVKLDRCAFAPKLDLVFPPFDARGAITDPPAPAARWDAKRAITFDLEIRGFRPAKDRCRITDVPPSPSPSFDDGPAAAGRVFFFTGVGIPEGRSSGRLKTPPGRGEKGPEGLVAAGLFVIIESASGVPG